MNKSRLEIYVEYYLKQNIFRMTTEKINLLRKALVFIKDLLENPVCDDCEPVVYMWTHSDDMFVKTVYNMTLNMSRDGNRKSLQRTIDMINKTITNCCT